MARSAYLIRTSSDGNHCICGSFKSVFGVLEDLGVTNGTITVHSGSLEEGTLKMIDEPYSEKRVRSELKGEGFQIVQLSSDEFGEDGVSVEKYEVA